MFIKPKSCTLLEDFSYYIPVDEITYVLSGWVKLHVQPPNYSCYDSDLDFYGFTEIEYIKIEKCSILYENDQETEVEYSSLNDDVKQEIERQLDQLIIEG